MQYQVYKESTGEVIAWIDPSKTVQICKNGYAIKAGNDLKVQECREEEENE